MFTSKQRSRLKSLAANIEPCAQMGKDGASENFLTCVSQALEARELIKINLLESGTDEPKKTAQEIADAVGAEVVIVMGRKAVLYRRSQKKGVEHIRY